MADLSFLCITFLPQNRSYLRIYHQSDRIFYRPENSNSNSNFGIFYGSALITSSIDLNVYIGHCLGLSTIKPNIDLNFAPKSKMMVVFQQNLKNVLRLKSWTKLSLRSNFDVLFFYNDPNEREDQLKLKYGGNNFFKF